MTRLESLRALARYQTHGGYAWAAVMGDGELLCVPCTRENYRQVYRATRGDAGTSRDWKCVGITHSGEQENETDEHCAHCGRVVFEGMTS